MGKLGALPRPLSPCRSRERARLIGVPPYRDEPDGGELAALNHKLLIQVTFILERLKVVGMFCRVTAFGGLALILIAGGYAAGAQSVVLPVPGKGAVAPPLTQGGITQPAPTPQGPRQPSPSGLQVAAPQNTAAPAAGPAANGTATPVPAAASSPAQAPVDKPPQTTAPWAAAPASKEPDATVTAPPPPKPAPIVVEAPMPRAKPAALKQIGKDRPAPRRSAASAQHASHLPAWLRAHIGTGDGQIAPVVLQRARALYLKKTSEGAVKNPCYFAMDATRPNDLGGGKLGRRFYIICEAKRKFRAVPAGHGSGRHLKSIANFRNERTCAKNFGNALDSKLTTGGAYLTSEIRTSFEGYYRVSGGKDAALSRSFVQFVGEGDTANARRRAIGGHAAVLLRGVCLRKDPESPHANDKGYVQFGKLVNYAGGRSNGCTSWSRSDARKIVAMVKDDPTTLYIYPDAADIDAVAQAVKAGRSLSREGLYWNTSCLKKIRSPKFWSKVTLGPILAQYKKHHPPPPRKPPPFCKERVVSTKN
jgi:hypothetical protein